MPLSCVIFAHCWVFMSHSVCFWIISKQNPAFTSRQTELKNLIHCLWAKQSEEKKNSDCRIEIGEKEIKMIPLGQQNS